jgi:hypothetical protein
MAAEGRSPVMFAHIGMLRALQHGKSKARLSCAGSLRKKSPDQMMPRPIAMLDSRIPGAYLAAHARNRSPGYRLRSNCVGHIAETRAV